MADTSGTKTKETIANETAFDMAIGASLFDTLGGGGEIFGRRNSLYANPNFFNALGLPRNNFTFVPTSTTPSFTMGMDMRTILGGNADVYSSNPSGRLAQNVMNMLMGGGIFGLLFAVGELNYATDEEKKLQQQQGRSGPPEQPQTDTPAQPQIQSLRPGTITPADDEAPARRATPVAATATAAADGGTHSIKVAPGVAAPENSVCNTSDTQTLRTCTITTKPKM